MDNVKVNSKEELHFMWFLEELLQAGYIDKYSYEPESIVLNKPLSYTYKDNKGRTKSKKYIPKKVYTYDFDILWNKKAYGIFFFDLDTSDTCIYTNKHLIPAQSCTQESLGLFKDSSIIEYKSRIEVKPEYDKHNMTRLAKSNIAYVWDKYDLYIHLIKPYELFSQFFYPKRMSYTDNNKSKRRKRKGIYVDSLPKIDDYLNKYINEC